MRQIKAIELIWLLIKVLFRHGNAPVYYHICGSIDSIDCPMEVEGIEIRKAYEDKVTIY